MKKIIIAISIILSLQSKAQNIDTVLVRDLTLQRQDWAVLIGAYDITVDSISSVGFRRIRNTVQANISGGNFATNLTIDSIPGAVAVELYRIVKTLPAGVIATRYTAITSAFAAKTNIAYWVGFYDAEGVAGFIRLRQRGKNLLID